MRLPPMRTLIILAMIAGVVVPILVVGTLLFISESTQGTPLRRAQAALDLWCNEQYANAVCPQWAQEVVNDVPESVLACIGNDQSQIVGESIGSCLIEGNHYLPPELWQMTQVAP